MLRIDETSNTLVTPEQAGLVAEPAVERDELLALLSSGWPAFANEIGEPQLRFVALAPDRGVELLAFDESAGEVVAVAVASELGIALAGAAAVSGWDADRLASTHASLTAAVPGESPRLMLVAADFDDELIATVDWLARRHGLEVTAHKVRLLRFGAERLVDVARVYPPPAPGTAPDFFASLAAPVPVPAPAASAPPPGVPAA